MATKKKETIVIESSSELIRLENLVENIQQSLAELNELLVELNEDFENVDFIFFDENENVIDTPKKIEIAKTWSIE